MTLKLTDEQSQAVGANPDQPIEFHDERTRKIYVLVEKDDLRRVIDETLRRELQIGFDQADSGDVADWDVDEILAEAHRRHA